MFVQPSKRDWRGVYFDVFVCAREGNMLVYFRGENYCFSVLSWNIVTVLFSHYLQEEDVAKQVPNGALQSHYDYADTFLIAV